MEIAGRHDDVFVGEDGGIVSRGVNLVLDDRRHKAQGVFGRSVHLRHATERVGVLHMHLVAAYQLAALEQTAYGGGGLNLPPVMAHLIDRGAERLDTAVEGIKRHGGDLVGDGIELAGAQHGPYGMGAHKLCAVEQRQTLLRL